MLTRVKNPESIETQLSSILDDLKYEDLYKVLTSKKKFACIGVLTTIDSRYIVLIAIDEPQVMHHTGGIIAVPLVKNVINKIAPTLPDI